MALHRSTLTHQFRGLKKKKTLMGNETLHNDNLALTRCNRKDVKRLIVFSCKSFGRDKNFPRGRSQFHED